MASVPNRMLSHMLRHASRRRTSLAPLNQRRAASSKHPRGFVAPTQADLQELRERVQDFTRWFGHDLGQAGADLELADREISSEVAQETDQSNNFPSHMWKKMGNAGLLGITVDEEYGGLAMGYQAHCVVMEELSRASGL